MKKDTYWSEVAHELIKTCWNLNLHIPVVINGKLSKTLGTYEFKKEKDKIIPLRIQLSKELVQHGSHQFVLFVLKHELCHFVLSQLRLPYQDGDKMFEKELKRIEAFSSKKIYVLYRIFCEDCERVFAFDSKKGARSAIERMPCACGHRNLSKLDVYYERIDEGEGSTIFH